jgi:hypothetical protein
VCLEKPPSYSRDVSPWRPAFAGVRWPERIPSVRPYGTPVRSLSESSSDTVPMVLGSDASLRAGELRKLISADGALTSGMPSNRASDSVIGRDGSGVRPVISFSARRAASASARVARAGTDGVFCVAAHTVPWCVYSNRLEMNDTPFAAAATGAVNSPTPGITLAAPSALAV